MRHATIAIVGRPNVGKSTLFNRILGERKAIVHDQPGVTRDRNYGTFEWRGRSVVLVDTGGYEPDPGSSLLAAMGGQVHAAVDEADVVLFVVDRKAGISPPDTLAADILRRSDKPVLLVVNKVDEPVHEAEAAEFWSLGFDHLHLVSAEHDRGVRDLLDAAEELLPPPEEGTPEDDDAELPGEIRIAILGRPNIGKSTLANRLIGQERHLVHDAPGTTMDAIDSVFQDGDRTWRIVDTAGVRKRARVHDALEGFAVSRAIKTIERCHVTLLMLDGTEPPGAQDARLASLVEDRGRALVILVNRWDLVREMEERNAARVEDEIRQVLPHTSWAPTLFISALTGKGCHRILPTVERVFADFDKRISTGILNRFLRDLEASHPPPQRYHSPVRIHYMTQARVRPPTFTFFCNTPDGIPVSYRRFLVNRLREEFGFEGTPLRIHIKRKRKLGEEA